VPPAENLGCVLQGVLGASREFCTPHAPTAASVLPKFTGSALKCRVRGEETTLAVAELLQTPGLNTDIRSAGTKLKRRKQTALSVSPAGSPVWFQK